MVNHKNIDMIVRRTLKRMGIIDNSIARLIKGTFLMESGLEDLCDYGNQRNRLHGFSMLSDERIDYLVTEYLRYRKNVKELIEEATGIALMGTPLEDVKSDMDHNISLMTAMTYYWYSSKFQKAPEDNIEAIAECYKKYFYDGPVDPELVQDFIEGYRTTFIDKY